MTNLLKDYSFGSEKWYREEVLKPIQEIIRSSPLLTVEYIKGRLAVDLGVTNYAETSEEMNEFSWNFYNASSWRKRLIKWLLKCKSNKEAQA